jgi:hypothetical protein
MVDRTALKINQFFVILFSLSAFLLNEPFIALLLGFIMIIGAYYPKLSIFQIFYHRIVKPSGWIQPELINEASNPHQFASVMGGTIVIVSTIFIKMLGLTYIGWGLILLVALLALTNLVLGFCMGCFIYFQLSRARRLLNSKGDI